MDESSIVVGLTTIVVLGVGAQWIGRRVGFPSILLLLPAGLIAGDVLGLVQPDELFGESLFPLVTLLVALLLFQSGLNLRLRDLPREARRPVVRLSTAGVLVTFLLGSVAVQLIFDGVDTGIAYVIGAILVVSGPTVVGPLLEVIRARRPTSAILAWEGTVLDPIGATLGVVVLNLVLASGRGGAHPIPQMLGRLGLGVTVGLIAAGLLVLVMSQFLVTDNMEAAVAVLFAALAFGVAETLLSEAGLFATTTLGIVAANQRIVPTARISGFGETLEVLIIGILFITLGATIEVSELRAHAWGIIVLTAVLVVVVRPAAALASLLGSDVPWRDRGMIAGLAPRGIVAAATAAQFSGVLTTAGYDADLVAPVVFGVILGAGIVYGLSARRVAKALDVTMPPPTGVALVGHHSWLFELARRLRDCDVPVVVITSRTGDAIADEGVPELPILESEAELAASIEDASIEKALICTRPGPLTMLVIADLVELLGRRHVLRVAGHDDTGVDHLLPAHLIPEAFGPEATLGSIEGRIEAGAEIRALGDDEVVPDGAVPLVTVRPDGTVDLKPGRRRRPTIGTRIVLAG